MTTKANDEAKFIREALASRKTVFETRQADLVASGGETLRGIYREIAERVKARRGRFTDGV